MPYFSHFLPSSLSPYCRLKSFMKFQSGATCLVLDSFHLSLQRHPSHLAFFPQSSFALWLQAGFGQWKALVRREVGAVGRVIYLPDPFPGGPHTPTSSLDGCSQAVRWRFSTRLSPPSFLLFLPSPFRPKDGNRTPCGLPTPRPHL